MKKQLDVKTKIIHEMMDYLRAQYGWGDSIGGSEKSLELEELGDSCPVANIETPLSIKNYKKWKNYLENNLNWSADLHEMISAHCIVIGAGIRDTFGDDVAKSFVDIENLKDEIRRLNDKKSMAENQIELLTKQLFKGVK